MLEEIRPPNILITVKTDAKGHSAGTNCSVSSLLPGATHCPCCKPVPGEMSGQVGGINHLNHCFGICCLVAISGTAGNTLSPTEHNSEKQQDRIPGCGKFHWLSTYFQDFLSFPNQKKKALALEKKFLRKMKCMKIEFSLDSAPSLAELFPFLMFSRSYCLMGPPPIWERGRGTRILGSEQVLDILW